MNEYPRVDMNELERMAKEWPDESFLKGSGVLKLIGAVRQLEGELRAVRADAMRYCWLRAKTGAGLKDIGSLSPSFRLPHIIPVRGANLMKGSVAQHLDAAIDAAIAQSASGSPARQGARPDGKTGCSWPDCLCALPDNCPIGISAVNDLSASASPATKEQQ